MAARALGQCFAKEQSEKEKMDYVASKSKDSMEGFDMWAFKRRRNDENIANDPFTAPLRALEKFYEDPSLAQL